MKFTKIVPIIAGLTTAVASLAPISASALSTASITMDAATSTNGQFSTVVYEDTGSDTVTGANVTLTFNQAVSNVSYDYSVGPFTATTPSGAHNAYGTVTGRNALARVSFSVDTPGTVIADVDTGSSYLKHVEGTTIQNFVFNAGESYFTYTKPAPVQHTAVATPAPAAPVVADTPAPLAPAKKATAKVATAPKVKDSHAGLVTSSVASLLVLLVAAYWIFIRKRVETAPAKAYKLNEATSKKSGASKASAKKSAAKKKA